MITVKFSQLRQDHVFLNAANLWWTYRRHLVPASLFDVNNPDRWDVDPVLRYEVKKVQVRLRQCPECDQLYYFGTRSDMLDGKPSANHACVDCTMPDEETEEGKEIPFPTDPKTEKVYILWDSDYGCSAELDEGDLNIDVYDGKDDRRLVLYVHEYEQDAQDLADQRNRDQDEPYDRFPWDGSRQFVMIEGSSHISAEALAKAGFNRAVYRTSDDHRTCDEVEVFDTDGDEILLYALYFEARGFQVESEQGPVLVTTDERDPITQLIEDSEEACPQ